MTPSRPRSLFRRSISLRVDDDAVRELATGNDGLAV
jgi:hypothetical protein